jgi:hypothetical protein
MCLLLDDKMDEPTDYVVTVQPTPETTDNPTIVINNPPVKNPITLVQDVPVPPSGGTVQYDSPQ